jgi:hypothetical protein
MSNDIAADINRACLEHFEEHMARHDELRIELESLTINIAKQGVHFCEVAKEIILGSKEIQKKFIISMNSDPNNPGTRYPLPYWVILDRGSKSPKMIAIDINGKLHTIRKPNGNDSSSRTIGEVIFDINSPYRKGERLLICGMRELTLCDVLSALAIFAAQNQLYNTEIRLANALIAQYETTMTKFSKHL